MKTVKRIIDVFSTVAIVLLVVTVLALQGTRLFGIRAYAVLSGSMEPKYHTGSVVYVKKVAPESIKKGDVITFLMNGSTTVTHRVVEVDSENKKFVTRGDANNTNDSPVDFSSVYGKVVYTVPYLGFVAVWISTTAGKIVLAAVFVILILLVTLSELLMKKTA